MCSTARVLAVDDNATNLAVIEEALDGLYEVRLAHDGEEALRIAPDFQPDVVLLDVMMPNVDGYEVCRRMRNDPSLIGVRIVMVSAKVKPADRQQGYLSGADDYLTKPFMEDELIAKIKVVLEAKRADRLGAVERELEDVSGGTADVLAMMTSLRGAESSAALVRVRSYCQVLAAELRVAGAAPQIDGRFLDHLYHASILHDVGQVALPDSILHKHGKLTASESEALKKHTLIGERLLHRLAMQNHGRMSIFRMAANIARGHHENWDGSGYPDGRAGEDIPLEARIVRVAIALDDAINRLQRKRPGTPLCEAFRDIADGSGTAFDPQIVNAACRLLDDLVDLHTDNDPTDSFELATSQ